MKIGVGLTVVLILIMVVQACAAIYAAYLIRRTKYSIIWWLCIVGFFVSIGQHIMFICSGHGYGMSSELYTTLDVLVSLCVVVAVMFAHRLVNHVERLNQQRSLFSKQILSAVLRAEERSRTTFSKELHDGMGPLLSSAKMSLSAISTENMSEEQQQILQNTRFLIDESIRSVREISNNVSPQVLTDFGVAHGIRNFLSRIAPLNVVEMRFMMDRSSSTISILDSFILQLLCFQTETEYGSFRMVVQHFDLLTVCLQYHSAEIQTDSHAPVCFGQSSVPGIVEIEDVFLHPVGNPITIIRYRNEDKTIFLGAADGYG